MIPYYQYRMLACQARPLLMAIRLPIVYGALLEIRLTSIRTPVHTHTTSVEGTQANQT